MFSILRHDVPKARNTVAHRHADLVRSHLVDAGFDDFVPHMSQVSEPSFLLGTTEDSAGQSVPVRIRLADLATHMLITGATGSGKTSFATWLLANGLRHGLAMGTLDCKAGFHEAALGWAAAVAYKLPSRERAAFVRRLVVVNPFGENLVPLNVARVAPGATAETQSYDVALVLSKMFEGSAGSFHFENVCRNLLILLGETGLSLIEAPDVLENELLRVALLTRVQNPTVKEFFGSTYAKVPSGSRDAVITRLRSLSLAEPLRLMLGGDDLVDFKGIFDRGDPLFLFLGMGTGIPQELVDILATLILQLVFQGIRGGEVDHREPYLLMADEFFHLIDTPELAKRFERGLDSFRAFGVHLGLVMHGLGQVPAPLQSAIQTHCTLQAIFRASSRSAQHFAEALPDTDREVVREALRRTGRVPPRFEMRSQLVERLNRLPERTYYLYDRRALHKSLKVRVPDLPAPHAAAGLTERELERFIADEGIGAGGLGLSRATLRKQLEQRRARLRELVNPRIVIQDPPSEGPDIPPSNGNGRRPRLG